MSAREKDTQIAVIRAWASGAAGAGAGPVRGDGAALLGGLVGVLFSIPFTHMLVEG